MAKQPPSSRAARTARLGGLVAGQSARWAGTRAANLVRSPEKAEAATSERVGALAMELVEQLGHLRGAAMKVGQVLSTIDFTALPQGEREAFKARLATLRDDVPPLPFAKLEKLVKQELGGPVSEFFAEFDRDAFAAASIGQVHRAVTEDGRDVAVKVQYPGVAEAVDTDLRNLGLLLPLVKRLAPGLDVKALARELTERIGEELDYEIEAQHHRGVARAYRGHPFVVIPAVDTTLSSRRILVTEYLEGQRFEAVKALPDPERDRHAEILFRFYLGMLHRTGLCSGDPHPGNHLRLADGRVGFFDFGLMRKVEPAYLERERALARAATDSDAESVHAILAELGYLPDPATFSADTLLDQLQGAGEWWMVPGTARLSPAYVAEVIETTSSPRSPHFESMRRMSLPAQALLVRRMEGLVFTTLGELRAHADWHGIGREIVFEAAPATALGELDATFWRGSGR